ncbi:MAG: hypothetical protein MUR45_03235 [OM182 bacterium]|nr:hypothetical protein [OM182 bacterium]
MQWQDPVTARDNSTGHLNNVPAARLGSKISPLPEIQRDLGNKIHRIKKVNAENNRRKAMR